MFYTLITLAIGSLIRTAVGQPPWDSTTLEQGTVVRFDPAVWDPGQLALKGVFDHIVSLIPKQFVVHCGEKPAVCLAAIGELPTHLPLFARWAGPRFETYSGRYKDGDDLRALLDFCSGKPQTPPPTPPHVKWHGYRPDPTKQGVHVYPWEDVLPERCRDARFSAFASHGSFIQEHLAASALAKNATAAKWFLIGFDFDLSFECGPRDAHLDRLSTIHDRLLSSEAYLFGVHLSLKFYLPRCHGHAYSEPNRYARHGGTDHVAVLMHWALEPWRRDSDAKYGGVVADDYMPPDVFPAFRPMAIVRHVRQNQRLWDAPSGFSPSKKAQGAVWWTAAEDWRCSVVAPFVIPRDLRDLVPESFRRW